MLFKEFPELRRQFWDNKLWEEGYFVRTAGSEVTGQAIQRYIERHQDNAPAEEEAA